MKKKCIYLLSAALLVATPAVTFTSCGDDNPVENTGGNSGGGNSGGGDGTSGTTGDRKLSSDEQKVKFDAVGKELINDFNTSNFTDLSDLYHHVCEAYFDNPYFDNSVVEDWFEEILDLNTTLLNIEKDDYSWESYDDGQTHTHYYSREYYKRLYALSNYTGHFTATTTGWIKSDAKDLQFNFTDKVGKACTLKLTTSGKTVTVPLEREEGDYEGYYDNGNYHSTETYYDPSFEVPENIEITLTQDGKTLVHTTVKSDLSNVKSDLSHVTDEEFDKMSISTQLTSEFEGYAIHVNRLAYSGVTGNGELTTSITKDNKVLLSVSLTAKNINVDIDETPEDKDFLTSGDGVNISLNILDKVRLEGTCDDLSDVLDHLRDCETFENDETNFKANLKLANDLLHIGSYFDNGKTKQTDVILGATFNETPWSSSKGYWTFEPLLKFDDSTTYSIGGYFNEKTFKSLIDSFEDMLKAFEELVD